MLGKLERRLMKMPDNAPANAPAGTPVNGSGLTWSWWYLLLLLQFVPALWVPFYNSVEPTFIGIPFFYWFQLALVLVSAVVTSVVYLATERHG
jgi:hypothetical protein